jgi:hypothetical protein
MYADTDQHHKQANIIDKTNIHIEKTNTQTDKHR